MPLRHRLGIKRHWAASVLCLLLGATGCGRDKALPPDLEALRANIPLSEAFDFVYLYSDSAKLRARLEAPHDLETMDRARKEPVHSFDRGLKLYFYDRTGRPETVITARSGLLWKRSGLAEAKGQVKLVNAKGEILESELLIWDRASRRIHTPAPVKITTAKEIIYGTGLESDLQFNRYKIFKTRGILSLGN